jgi:hypothetical protein
LYKKLWSIQAGGFLADDEDMKNNVEDKGETLAEE